MEGSLLRKKTHKMQDEKWQKKCDETIGAWEPTDDEAERGEHGDAAVRDLHVGVALRLGLVDVVVEAEQVNALVERYMISEQCPPRFGHVTRVTSVLIPRMPPQGCSWQLYRAAVGRGPADRGGRGR
jgi:hypothetical protein